MIYKKTRGLSNNFIEYVKLLEPEMLDRKYFISMNSKQKHLCHYNLCTKNLENFCQCSLKNHHVGSLKNGLGV